MSVSFPESTEGKGVWACHHQEPETWESLQGLTRGAEESFRKSAGSWKSFGGNHCWTNREGRRWGEGYPLSPKRRSPRPEYCRPCWDPNARKSTGQGTGETEGWAGPSGGDRWFLCNLSCHTDRHSGRKPITRTLWGRPGARGEPYRGEQWQTPRGGQGGWEPSTERPGNGVRWLMLKLMWKRNLVLLWLIAIKRKMLALHEVSDPDVSTFKDLRDLFLVLQTH